jgi:hypothetical protein
MRMRFRRVAPPRATTLSFAIAIFGAARPQLESLAVLPQDLATRSAHHILEREIGLSHPAAALLSRDTLHLCSTGAIRGRFLLC